MISKLVKNNRGIALFLVLWVLTFMIVIAGEFCHTMKTGINITRNFKESAEAFYIARAGISTAIINLINNNQSTPKSKELFTENDMDEDEDSVKWRINARIQNILFGRGEFKVRLENESGKVNINRAGKQLLKMALNRFDCDDHDRDVIVDSIIDWRDQDNFHQLNGAEDDYYRSLPEPYECKDSNFDSVEELLLIRGMTAEIFYGGLRNMVTIYPRSDPVIEQGRNKKRSSRGRRSSFNYNRININAASKEMLSSLPQMNDELVQEILDYRKKEDFFSMTDASSLLGPEVYKSVAPYITLQTTPFYIINSIGSIADSNAKCGMSAVIRIDYKLKNKYTVVQWIYN